MKKGYHPKGLVWVYVKENNCLEMRNFKTGRFQHSIQSGLPPRQDSFVCYGLWFGFYKLDFILVQ